MKILHLSVTLLLALCSTAYAHGGGYRDASPPPPPTPSCICGELSCTTCSHDELVTGKRLDVSETEVDVLGEWGDVRSLLITTTFQSKEGERNIEAYAALAVAPVLGVTSASVGQRTTTLTASLTPAAAARKQYFTSRLRLRDPLLLTAKDPGRYDLRAFPVSSDTPTIVFVEGFALADRPCHTLRLYRDKGATRDGRRYMALVPLSRHRPAKDAALVDRARNRAVYFLDAKEARARFGTLLHRAVDLPGAVAALERAVRCDPSEVWVAVEARSPGRTVPPPPSMPEPPPGTTPNADVPPPPPPTEPVGQVTAGASGS